MEVEIFINFIICSVVGRLKGLTAIVGVAFGARAAPLRIPGEHDYELFY